MQWQSSGLIVSWEFTKEKRGEKTRGTMVIIKSLQFLPEVFTAALSELTHTSGEGLSSVPPELNVVHIALVGIDSQISPLQDRYIYIASSMFILLIFPWLYS